MQIIGNAADDRLGWTAGLFYFESESRAYNTTEFGGFDFEAIASAPNTVDAHRHHLVQRRDRVAGTTELVSLDPNGAQADGGTSASSMSADGRYVVIFGSASNLVARDTNGSSDVFVRDRLTATTQRVSVDSNSRCHPCSWRDSLPSRQASRACCGSASSSPWKPLGSTRLRRRSGPCC